MDNGWQVFLSLAENSRDFIALFSPDGALIYINGAGCRQVEVRSLEEAIALPMMAYLAEPAELAPLVQQTIEQGQWEKSGRLRQLQTGGWIDVQQRFFVVSRDQTGNVKCIGTIQQRQVAAAAIAEPAKPFAPFQASNGLSIKTAAASASTETASTATSQLGQLDQLRAIADPIPLPVVICRASDGQILYGNRQAASTWGYAPDDLMQMDGSHLFVQPSDYRVLLQRLAHQSQAQHSELQGQTKTGEPIWVSVAMQALTVSGAAVVLSVFNNISRYKQLEHTLDSSAEPYRQMVDLSPDAVVLHHAGKLVYVNSAAATLLGCHNPASLIGQSLMSFVQSDDRPIMQRHLNQLLQGQTIAILQEEKLVRRDCSVIAVEIAGSLITYQGQPTVQFILRDLTRYQQPELQLKQGASQQAAVVQLGEIALAEGDEDEMLRQAVVLVSDTLGVKYCQILDLLPNGQAFFLRAGVGWNLGMVGAARIGAQADLEGGYTLKRKAPVIIRDLPLETRFRGSPMLHNHHIVSGISVPIALKDNDLGVLGVYTTEERLFSDDDVHFVQAIANIVATAIAHKRAVTRLNLLERAIAASRNGIVISDPNQFDNPLVYVNPAFETITGYRAEEVLGYNCRFLQGPFADQPELQVLRLAIREQRECSIVLQNIRKDGTMFWNELSIAPVFDAAGQLTHFIGIQTDITESKQADAALWDSQRRLDSILNSLEDIVWSASFPDMQVFYLNRAAAAIFGRPISEFINHSNLWLDVIHPDDRPQVASLATLLLETGSKDLEYRILQPNGSVRWLRDRARVVYDELGMPIRIDGIATDITKRKYSEDALRKSEEQFRLTFKLAPIGMAIMKPNGQLTRVNQAMCDALGFSAEDLLKLNVSHITHPDDLPTDLLLNQKLLQGDLSHFQIEKRFIAKSGKLVHTILQAALICDAHNKPLHIIGQIIDITERRRMEEKLLFDTLHDALTGLPNRTLFMERLQQAIATSQANPSYQFAVMFLDLDRFKVINDSLGHMLGDQLLVAIARCLETCLRPGDTVAHLGGDEFTILLAPIQQISDALQVAERIQSMLKQPFNLSGYEVFTTASIGIAPSTITYESPSDLLRDADTAMYRAKERGKACHAVFDVAMYNRAVSLLQLETDLRRAIERDELLVYYQPIISLKTCKIIGFEALARWQHPRRGLIPPAEFIPVAEETGLIAAIGHWVLHSACKQMHQWHQQFSHIPPLSLSVNLSVRQFSRLDLADQIRQVLQDTQLPASSLKLEITESSIMQNSELAAMLLEQLKAIPIQLSIDDFGTGYSSLSRLHQFPIDTLKIDRSFVGSMSDQIANVDIAQAIVRLAHSLGMDVVAEGLESAAQLAQLRQMGCEYGQGYYFSPPVPADDAAELINKMF